nr:DNA mismatch repair protein MutS [uncultured Dyadobacter sp.]
MKILPEQEPKHRIKTAFCNFMQIEKYFLHAKHDDALQIISDRTFKDLDMEDVFRFADRTVSCVGQQYLYALIRSIPRDATRIGTLERIINVFRNDPALRTALTTEISRLNKSDAYYITSLFQEKYLQRPSWFWLIRILCGISVVSIALSFFFPQILVLVIILFPVNMGIHYWNKNNLYRYGSSIPQLFLLNQVAKKIMANAEFAAANKDLQKSIEMLNRLGPQMSVFRMEAKLQGEIGQFVEYVLELFKAFFLLEPVLMFTTLRVLDAKRQDISDIFHFVAECDVALSVLALRESLPHYCQITSEKDKMHLIAREIYHPLLFNGVPNDLVLKGKSALLTGSNMSGKTTFIRTMGINAILGQTINTCFAKEFAMPLTKIHSSIRISDDLLDEKSYYFEEVTTLKHLIEESGSSDNNLFLLDELFKGTNSVERIAIGKSALSYMTRRGNKVLVSTHDVELADYLTDTFDLYHFTELIEENKITFDYKIKPGKLTTTNAIRILSLNQYPAEIVEEALRLSQELKGKN